MSKEPSRNVYVGHRYVPKIMGEWDNQTDYEGLSIVTQQGASYTSKKRVPVGIDILNEEFWVLTGNYDAQVEYYRRDVNQVMEDMSELDNTLTTDLIDTRAYVDNEVIENKEYVDSKVDDLTIYVNDETASARQYVNDEVGSLTSHVNSMSINVMYPPDGFQSAKGDGVTDDTIAIQNILDHVISKNGGTVEFPEGHTFLISDELTIQGSYQTESEFGYVALKSTGKGVATIQRMEILPVDTGILHVTGTDLERFIILNGIELDGVNKNVKYGFYSDPTLVHCDFEHFYIKNVKEGFMLNGGAFLCTYRNFRISYIDNGFHIVKASMSTTNLIENGYIMGAHKTAWKLGGGYSTAINLASDHCQDLDYDFEYAQFSITSMGSERSEGDYVLRVRGECEINIDNFSMNSNHNNKAYIMNDSYSTIDINTLSIGGSEPEKAPNYLFDFGYGSGSVTKVRNIQKIPPKVEKILIDDYRTPEGVLVTRNNPIIFLEGVYYKPGNNINTGEQYYRDYLSLNDEQGHKNITFSDTTPENINGRSFRYDRANPKGTIHLRKQLDNGQFAYIRSDDEEDATYRLADYKVIPYINSGFTEDRPADDLIRGQMFFDITLAKPIWWSGTRWVDATGETMGG